MSLNTLETAYANGEIIDASHINELTLALLGALVGRDGNGVPTPNQSLGTLAIPWGNLYAKGIILNGLALDAGKITSLPNRIVSGKTRSLSSAPDFLRADGISLAFDILGASVDLVLSINNDAVSISSDLNKTGVVAAPAANNTAQVNDLSMSNSLYAGEDGTAIIIDNVGSEITSLVGQIVALKTPTGEILQGYLKTSALITNCFRGFYYDSSGNPIARGNLSNNDVLTLMRIGWVFIEDNGTTIDISYTTPSKSFAAPSSPSTGDYWFDISNQIWKRYSGISWDIINRILIGNVVSDDTDTIASRSGDFSNNFEDTNNVDIEIFSTEIIKSKEMQGRINVYGTEVQIDHTFLGWNITTDLESPLVEAPDTTYYIYLSDQGEPVISNEKPYYREDLKGSYHPYHSWRVIGSLFNDNSSDIVHTKIITDSEEGIVGGVITLAYEITPDDHLFCDGSSIRRVEFPELFKKIGVKYGSVDGNHFNIPDGRGVFFRGFDNGRGIDTGRVFGTYQNDATKIPNIAFTTNASGNHTHLVYSASVTAGSGANTAGRADSGNPDLSDDSGGAGDHSHSITGGGDAETRPDNITVNYYIKYQ